eukprot:jgi/Botrbrau1/1803/Bobra.146_1s0002.1
MLQAGHLVEHPLPDLQRHELVCRIHLSASKGDWWEVLGLEKGKTADIRQQFKRLALQVHPDKCTCFGAESAFKLLQKAAEKLSAASGDVILREGADDLTSPGPKWWDIWDQPTPANATQAGVSSEATGEDATFLASLSLEELKEEVRVRSSEVLVGVAPARGGSLPRAQRLQRLRQARTALSDRLQEESTAPVVAETSSEPQFRDSGGFLW